MKALLYYLVQVIVTSGILYAWYHFALRNKKFHRYNRFYLLAATGISITIPFLNIPVYFTQSETNSSFVLQTLTVISSPGVNDVVINSPAVPATLTSWFTLQNILYLFYCLIIFIALFRIFYSLLKIKKIIRNNPVEQLEKIHFVNTDEPGTPFSFFRWLFWNKKIELQSEKGGQIFRHELFHIKQKHSLDILYMELLTAVCWLNPFFHLMKREVKAIHEFLADRFAVTENTKWQYAELLLMQAMNTNQRLVNPFFHNQIKRRIAMITTSKKTGPQYFRKLLVLPIAAIAILLFAFSYKKKNSNETGYDPTSFSNSVNTDTTGLVKITEINLVDTASPSNDFKVSGGIALKDKSGKPAYLKNATLTYTGFNNKDTGDNKYMVILDGKEQSELKSISEIGNLVNHDDIIQINIIKGVNAVSKYGARAKKGVMEIFTKKSIKVTEVTLTDNKIFDKVEIEPFFPGGAAKWRQYIERNLDAAAPVRKKAPTGVYTVVVQFVVDREGNISDVKALTNHGYGMEEEAIRVIKSGPRWQPAMQSGQVVKAYKKQPITFIVGKGQKNFPSDDKVFDKVETPPSFPSGDSAWRKYLIKNINATLPVDSGAPAGTYKILVQFIVHEDGSLSDIKATTKYGYGMENEAMRIIKIGPKWIPAKQNGHIVMAYVQQPVTFQVTEEVEDNSKQNSLQPTTIASASLPKITIDEFKKASVYKLLQLPEGSEILSYVFTTDLANGDFIEIHNSGNEFNVATIVQINQAKAGRIITFEHIRIMKDGQEKKMPAKVYVIMD